MFCAASPSPNTPPPLMPQWRSCGWVVPFAALRGPACTCRVAKEGRTQPANLPPNRVKEGACAQTNPNYDSKWHRTQPHSSHIRSSMRNTIVHAPDEFKLLHRMSQRWRERTRRERICPGPILPAPGRVTLSVCWFSALCPATGRPKTSAVKVRRVPS